MLGYFLHKNCLKNSPQKATYLPLVQFMIFFNLLLLLLLLSLLLLILPTIKNKKLNTWWIISITTRLSHYSKWKLALIYWSQLCSINLTFCIVFGNIWWLIFIFFSICGEKYIFQHVISVLLAILCNRFCTISRKVLNTFLQ